MLAALLATVPGRAYAQSPTAFYVSPAGNDGNSGSESQPFRTLERARDAVRVLPPDWSADVTVFVRGGTHWRAEPFLLNASDSGRNGFRLSYRNYPGDSPVISAGQPVSGWMRDGDLWKAAIAAGREARQLYVNGTRAVRARSAGTLPGAQLTATGYLTSDEGMRNWSNLQDAELVIDSLWRQFRAGIGTVSGNTITLDQPGWSLVNSGYPVQPGDAVYVENAFELLDAPGEWYLNRQTGWLYYRPRAGEEPQSAVAVLSGIEALVSATGTAGAPIHDLTIEGLTFAHAGWVRPSTADGFAEVQANWFATPTGLARMPAAVTIEHSRAIALRGNTFAHLGGAGLSLGKGSFDDVVNGNHFADISGTALQLGDVDNANATDANVIPRNNQLTNNYIHDAATEYNGGVGIWIGYARATRVAHNELHDLPYTAISIGWGWGEGDPSIARDNIVEENLIYDHVKRLIDGGAIYSLSAQPGNVYRANVMLAQYGEYGSLYLDNGSRYITASDNIIFGNRRVALIKGGVAGGDHYLHDNWWQDRYPDDIWYYQEPGSYVTTAPGPNRVENNHVIAALGDAPASILAAAGLEPQYNAIRGSDPRPPTTPPASPVKPAAPTALVPARSVVADAATLSWAAVPHATSYHLSITNRSRSTIERDVDVASTAYTFPIVSGESYHFTVSARNQIGEGPSATSAPFSFAFLPAITVDRGFLQFAALCAATCTQQAGVQHVRITQTGAGVVTWTAVPTQPWIRVEPAAGSGPATLRITADPGSASPATTGAIVLSFIGARSAPAQIDVAYRPVVSGTSAVPFGTVDTPTSGTAGVSGSIAFTGWALDDVGVTAIRIFREPVAAEAGGLVFIGNAIRVAGARPDVAAAFGNSPDNTAAGWGYLMLTDFLPHGGNGTFTFHVIAEDGDGHQGWLGATTITCANADAVTPFGAIDTPAPGETIAGVMTNFGWVLGRGQRRADGSHGGVVTVLIDGIPVGTPAGWVPRSDLTALFPASQFAGVASALGVFSFDTTTLADGVHSIAWVVIDDEGNAAGIGSRFFVVANGGS